MLINNKNRERTFTRGSMFRTFPVAPNTTIYEGAIVCIDENGYAINAQNGRQVVGIAEEQACENGNVIVETGVIEKIPYINPSPAMINKHVYAINNDEIAINGSDVSCLGRVFQVDNNSVWVELTC